MNSEIARAALPSGLIAIGGLIWAAAMVNALIVGEGGLDGSVGLIAITAGLLAARMSDGPAGPRRFFGLRWLELGAGLVVVALAAAAVPVVRGVILFLVVPTAFALGPLFLSGWAVKRAAASSSLVPRLAASGMLVAVVAGMALPAGAPGASTILFASFGLLAIAYGATIAR